MKTIFAFVALALPACLLGQTVGQPFVSIVPIALGTGAYQPQTVLTGTASQIAVSNSGVGATTVSIVTSPTIPGAPTFLTGNAGTFLAGQMSRSANWGLFLGAPATGGVADMAFLDFAQLTGLRILPTAVDTYVNVGGVSTKIFSVGATGATVTGTIGALGFARVTGDVTNATATMVNLTNLSVTVSAGTKYVGTIQVFANDSTNTDGLAFDLGGGSATFTDLEFGFSAQPAGSTLGTVTSTPATTPGTLTVVSTSDAVYTISFAFTCNAGGTLIPRFSQTAHSTGTATVRKNSGIIALVSTN